MEATPASSDLERFRQQWQQEVQARTQNKQTRATSSRHGHAGSEAADRPRPERPINRPPTRHPLEVVKHDDDALPSSSAQGPFVERFDRLNLQDADADEFSRLGRAEPHTALEHYERAVEKEGQGKLGDSLSHYRKAFRLDDTVDQTYKEKHFAHKWKKPANVNTSSAAPTVPSTAHHSLGEAGDVAEPLTTSQLIASFADCEIPNAPPIIEGDLPPPCPIRKLPTEVLFELLRHVVMSDVAAYARLACVCKKLAYHVYRENSIWKQVALGPEVGLASQKYHFVTDVQGRPVIWQALEDDDEDERPMPSITDEYFPKDQDFRSILHSYPRIRFSGVYISTVNYTRSGGASVTPSTWGSQVHIVTYYRYLRFFRDGTVISLLTTHEPVEVVHLLTKENVAHVRSNSKEPIQPFNFSSAGHSLALSQHPSITPPTASNILKQALRGRWRLCHPSLADTGTEIGSNIAPPGDLHIETEGGAGPRYMYTMHLSLKHGNTRNKFATKNNKLIWKGFWSYNSLTDDWAEFQLRNDKAFWFSRVKSYGMGQ